MEDNKQNDPNYFSQFSQVENFKDFLSSTQKYSSELIFPKENQAKAENLNDHNITSSSIKGSKQVPKFLYSTEKTGHYSEAKTTREDYSELRTGNKPLREEDLVVAYGTVDEGSGNKTSSKDSKFNSSYVDAMKALQKKIKFLENESDALKQENTRLSEENRIIISRYEKKLEEANDSYRLKENDLKALFEESQNIVRQAKNEIEDYREKIEKLRETLKISDYERDSESTRNLREITKLQSRVVDQEMEMKMKDSTIADLKVGLEEMEKENNYLRTDLELEKQRNSNLYNEQIKNKNEFEEKLKIWIHKSKDADQKLFTLTKEVEFENKKRIETENELVERIQSLNEKVTELAERETRLIEEMGRNNDLIRRKELEIEELLTEITTLRRDQDRQKFMYEYTSNYAKDVAKQNSKLITNLLTSVSKTTDVSPRRSTSARKSRSGRKEDDKSGSRPVSKEKAHSKSRKNSIEKTPRKGELRRTASVNKKETQSTPSKSSRINKSETKPIIPNLNTDVKVRKFESVERRSTHRDERKSLSQELEMIAYSIAEKDRELVQITKAYQILTKELMNDFSTRHARDKKQNELDEMMKIHQSISSQLAKLKKREENLIGKLRI